jgi:hypothetical protein
MTPTGSCGKYLFYKAFLNSSYLFSTTDNVDSPLLLWPAAGHIRREIIFLLRHAAGFSFISKIPAISVFLFLLPGT